MCQCANLAFLIKIIDGAQTHFFNNRFNNIKKISWNLIELLKTHIQMILDIFWQFSDDQCCSFETSILIIKKETKDSNQHSVDV